MSLHVVFGAGQVGTVLTEHLLRAGHAVRVVRRSDGAVPEGAERVLGDAADVDFAVRASAGAAAIYHCINPSTYSVAAWNDLLPRVGAALIEAAIRNDARLVVLDNLYAYGISDGPRTESTPLRAEGGKGLQRIAFDAALRQAKERGLRYAVGRAGDFFGPGTAENSLLSMSVLEGLTKGKSVYLLGRIDEPHAFSYVPDVAAGLAALGLAESDVEGRVYHLPVITTTARKLVEDLAAALGVRARYQALPPWAIRTLGLVVPLMRELRETLYQWDRPFLVDDSAFRARFPTLATAPADAIAATAARVTSPRGSATSTSPGAAGSPR